MYLKERFGEGSTAWKDRGETSERKTTDQVLGQLEGGYPGEYAIRGPGGDGAGPERMAFYGRPRRPRHGTSVR